MPHHPWDHFLCLKDVLVMLREHITWNYENTNIHDAYAFCCTAGAYGFWSTTVYTLKQFAFLLMYQNFLLSHQNFHLVGHA